MIRRVLRALDWRIALPAIVLYVALHMMWQGHQDVVRDLGYAPAYNAAVPDFMDIPPAPTPAH